MCPDAHANQPPEVTNVIAQQRESSMEVSVTYDVYDPDGDLTSVRLPRFAENRSDPYRYIANVMHTRADRSGSYGQVAPRITLIRGAWG
ncbi:hypothetical protein ACFL6M_03105 [Candidatus Eisenbacteria bacterium]|uniref:TonB C-terminal domain-containing protein n=1 Tax=Eiseniibacteriota bacterium TaxID=2212470 RepID=A0ABV6YJP6_UNCEI